jgi:hypothetical protein
MSSQGLIRLACNNLWLRQRDTTIRNIAQVSFDAIQTPGHFLQFASLHEGNDGHHNRSHRQYQHRASDQKDY